MPGPSIFNGKEEKGRKPTGKGVPALVKKWGWGDMTPGPVEGKGLHVLEKKGGGLSREAGGKRETLSFANSGISKGPNLRKKKVHSCGKPSFAVGSKERAKRCENLGKKGPVHR